MRIFYPSSLCSSSPSFSYSSLPFCFLFFFLFLAPPAPTSSTPAGYVAQLSVSPWRAMLGTGEWHLHSAKVLWWLFLCPNPHVLNWPQALLIDVKCVQRLACMIKYKWCSRPCWQWWWWLLGANLSFSVLTFSKIRWAWPLCVLYSWEEKHQVYIFLCQSKSTLKIRVRLFNFLCSRNGPELQVGVNLWQLGLYLCTSKVTS